MKGRGGTVSSVGGKLEKRKIKQNLKIRFRRNPRYKKLLYSCIVFRCRTVEAPNGVLNLRTALGYRPCQLIYSFGRTPAKAGGQVQRLPCAVAVRTDSIKKG